MFDAAVSLLSIALQHYSFIIARLLPQRGRRISSRSPFGSSFTSLALPCISTATTTTTTTTATTTTAAAAAAVVAVVVVVIVVVVVVVIVVVVRTTTVTMSVAIWFSLLLAIYLIVVFVAG